MVDDKPRRTIDLGTRQWTPEDELVSARMILQRRLDTQRARRALHHGSNERGAAALPGARSATHLAQITLSYPELLRALSLAAVDQRGVTLTRTSDNVFLKLVDGSDAGPSAYDVAGLTDLELSVRDRLEASVARRYVELHGPDHDLSEGTTHHGVVAHEISAEEEGDRPRG